jgi:hypothetical protein
MHEVNKTREYACRVRPGVDRELQDISLGC